MSIVPSGYYLANSCNYLFPPDGLEIHALLGILNSKLINWFFRCFSTNSNVNGYEIDNLPIPFVDEHIQVKLKELVSIIVAKKYSDIHTETFDEESKIDKIVYQIYGLTEEEIKIVEGNN